MVSDASGLPISGASVQASDIERNLTSRAASNEAGIYRFESLPPGTYTLTVAKAGFETVRRPAVNVSVGAVAGIDFRLEVAPVGTTVTVEGGAPLVDTVNSSLSSVSGAGRIAALPLNTRSAARNVYDLLVREAGAAPAASMKEDEFGPHIHGARSNAGNYQLDGADNNNRQAAGANLFSVPVPVEAVAEFRLATNDFSAEYGRNSGFIANAVTKSGTNQLHGSLWEFFRNDALDARDASTWRSGARKDVLRQNNYGASAGGPLRRDRTFFYSAFERFRKGTDFAASAVVPTREFIAGMPSGFAKDLVTGIYRDLTPVQNFVDFYGSYQVDPVKRTGIPKTQRSDPGFPHPQFGTAFYRNSTKITSDNFVGKLDHSFGAGLDRAFARYAYYTNPSETEFLNGVRGNQPNPLIGGHNITFGHTRALGSRALNEARFGFNRYLNQVNWSYGQQGLPVMNCGVQAYGQQQPCFGLPGIGLDPSISRDYRENSVQMLDNISYTGGRHSVKVGLEYRRHFDFTVGGGGSVLFGQLLFADAISFANNLPLQVTMQVDPAGSEKAGRLQPSVPQRRWRQHEIYWFIQEEFRVTRRLTLNAGLRYEYFSVPHNADQQLDSNFYFDSARVGEGVFRRTLDNPGDLKGFFWRPDKNNFAPRFGLAFDPFGDGKMSIRAAFGMAYDRMINNLSEAIKNNLPSVALVTLRNDFAAGVVPVPSVVLPLTEGVAAARATGLPGAARAVDPNLRTSYYYESFFGLQRQIGRDVVLEANTVWNAGRKLGLMDYFNRRPGGQGKTLNPVLGDDVFASNYRSNSVGSNYNALELRLSKRYSRGLQFETNYTWAHSLDAASGVYNGSQAARGLVDFGNWRLSYGNSDFDIRHRWSTTLHYELPYGSGSGLARQLLGGWRIAGIFTLSSGTPFSIVEQVDDPNRDGWGFDFMTYTGVGKPAAAVLANKTPVKGGVQYLDPALFTFTGNFPLAGHTGLNRTYGNTGRNQIYGPGRFDNDVGVHKDLGLPWSERARLELRAELFNLMNHPYLNRLESGAASGNGLLNGTFGQSYYAGGRQVQLGARLSF